MKLNLENLFTKKTETWKVNLVANWKDAIGNLHQKVRIEKVYDDTVVLGVYDTCWMQELHLLSEMIIYKINTYLKEPHIKNIKLRYVQKGSAPKSTYRSKGAIHNYKPTNFEIASLKKINDPELKKALESFLIKCHAEFPK